MVPCDVFKPIDVGFSVMNNLTFTSVIINKKYKENLKDIICPFNKVINVCST